MPDGATLTVAEGLGRCIAQLGQLSRIVGSETALGLGFSTVKANLQRIERGAPVDRDHWLSVGEALKRAERPPA